MPKILRVEIDKYTNKVLLAVKKKFKLKTKSEAICKFVDFYGDEFLGLTLKPKCAKEVPVITKNHIKKYGYEPISRKELNKLFGIKS